MAIPFKYNRRSLLIRRVSNSMTVGAIAIVVGVFVAAMAIVGGLNSAIKDSSSPDNMILIGRSADSEANSFMTLDQLDALKFLPAIKRDGVGNPLVSPELAEQVFMPAGDTLDNLPIRGVLPLSTQIHEKVRVIAGRMFAPGLNEVIIGKLIVNQYPGCSLGADLKVGRRIWKVVGVFESGGSSFESEVWADLHSLQEDSRRGSSFSSIRLKLVPGADVHSLIQRCADDPRINLQAKTESEYYKEQSGIAANLRALGLLVAGIMAFAAGIIGVILALPVNGLSTKFNGGAVSAPTLAFNFHVTPVIAIQALVFAIVIGALGGRRSNRAASAVGWFQLRS